MRRLRILSLTIGFLAMISLSARAQTVGATTGAINGKVADATGGVMPGVTVTIASPSMQGIRTAVTDGEGLSTLPGDSNGDYKMGPTTSLRAFRPWSARASASVSDSPRP